MKNKNKNLIILGLVILLLLPTASSADEVADLNSQIKDKQAEIDGIKQKMEVYQKNIKAKQSEAASLKNQLAIIENGIAKTELDIKATQLEISQKQLETRNVEIQILGKEEQLDKQRQSLQELLQQIHLNDEENSLKIFILNNSLASFFSQLEYTKDLQVSLQDSVGAVKIQKQELNAKQTDLAQKQTELENLKEALEFKAAEMKGESTYKNDLLAETKNSEQKYNTLYWQLKQEQQKIASEVTNLEKQARNKLSELQKQKLQSAGAVLDWPIPNKGITAYFHDPDYPFRYIFEHPAIDVRARQGTQIQAPADGYILTAKNAGMGYSYVAIMHADGISTVYGHVSKIYVKADEFVTKGFVIALTGGMPGTPGAGNLSNGPHLHFEVRVNGIPANALDYLP